MIEHVPKGTEERLLREISRVLRPGRKLYLTTPNRNVRSRFTDPAYLVAGHRHYGEHDPSTLARSSGFEIEAMRSIGGWYEVLYLWNLHISKWILRRAPLFESWFADRMTPEYSSADGFMGWHCVFRRRQI